MTEAVASDWEAAPGWTRTPRSTAATVLGALRPVRVPTVLVEPAPQPASASTAVAFSSRVARRGLKRSRDRATAQVLGNGWRRVGRARQARVGARDR